LLAVRGTVIIWTVSFPAVPPMLAFFLLEEAWVVLLFLPAMREGALVLVGTAFLVARNEVASFPVGTHLLTRVLEDIGLSSVILPIMSVDTDLAIMVILAIRTPDCFEVKHVEVHVDFVLLDHLD
jgi:hypothetical protein